MAKFIKGQLVIFDERIFEVKDFEVKDSKFFYDLKLVAHLERSIGGICDHFDEPNNVVEDQLQNFLYRAPYHRLGERRSLGIIHLIIFKRSHDYVYNLAERVVDGHIGSGGSSFAGLPENEI